MRTKSVKLASKHLGDCRIGQIILSRSSLERMLTHPEPLTDPLEVPNGLPRVSLRPISFAIIEGENVGNNILDNAPQKEEHMCGFHEGLPML